MPSAHRFLASSASYLPDAELIASSILPATDIAFQREIARSGSARAIVSGGYVGAKDAALEIEIVSASGTGLLSAPTFSGAGNGTMSSLEATGVPSQTFTVLLASTGTETKAAALPFYGVVLKAKATGTAGNGIALAVNTSGLVFTAAAYSFFDEAKAGDSEFSGPEWDFGGYPLTADGDLDSRSARLRFGADPQIYRQYKTFADGDWSYVVDPPIVRDLPAETPVYAVTGSYTVTVTQGATVETYTSLVTLFDLLNALKTRSNMIEVDGVVVDDRTPGGMAAEDVPARTDAYALPARYEGNASFPGLGTVTVPVAAPTQIVSLTCTDTSTLGGELWSVKGSVSGDLIQAQTGKPYSAGGYGWTIPVIEPPEVAAPTGKIYVKSVDLVSRGEGEDGVELCVRPLIAGAKAKAKTVTVTYTAKPPADCPCDTAQVSGTLSEQCLGVKIDGETSMALVAGYQTRLETLYGWRADFVAANTAITAAGELRAAQNDLQLCDIATTALAQCLADVFGASSTPDSDALTAWDAAMTGLDSDLTPLEAIGAEAASAVAFLAASTAYSAGDVRAARYGYYLSGTPFSFVQTTTRYLRCTVAGTTGATRTPDANSYLLGTTCDIDFGTAAFETITATEAGISAGGDNADINAIAAIATDPGISRDPAAFAKRYEAKMDKVRALAGIVPKSDAGGGGSDCWQPCDGDYEWRVNGLEYLPACTNVPYHSCVMVSDAKGEETVISTQEFGFVIRVGCPDKLKEGDSFTFVIENDANPVKTYEVGDQIKVPVIAGEALTLAGGVTGDDTLTWTVRGSLGATWADYEAEKGSEPLYSQSGLKFRIVPGGVPFALGDAFSFSVAGGTFRWRVDSGAWSSNITIGSSASTLQDGLSVLLSPGPAPAFVAGDRWLFDLVQPHAPDHVLDTDRSAWRWSGTGANLEATFSADKVITAVSIWHDCPSGATFSLAGLSSIGATMWTKTVTYRTGYTVAIFEGVDAVASCRSLKLTVANASGGSVKWWWAGQPWAPVHGASSVKLANAWDMVRGTRSSRLVGRGASGEIAWSVSEKSWMESADQTALLALIDELKAAGDQPFGFVPSRDFPQDARLVKPGVDDVEFEDYLHFEGNRRMLSVRLPLAMVVL
jgi:hypothetical protein